MFYIYAIAISYDFYIFFRKYMGLNVFLVLLIFDKSESIHWPHDSEILKYIDFYSKFWLVFSVLKHYWGVRMTGGLATSIFSWCVLWVVFDPFGSKGLNQTVQWKYNCKTMLNAKNAQYIIIKYTQNISMLYSPWYECHDYGANI